MTAGAWLEGKVSAAPAALQHRITHLAESVGSGALQAGGLARVATATLGSVIRGSGDRSAALDLLAADALITLALLAQAESDPAGLGEFSIRLLGAGVARA